MRKIILLFFITCTFLVAEGQIRLGDQKAIFDISYSNPKEYEIGGIEVTGVKNLDERSLISVTGLEVGDEITIPGDEITNAIKKLWKQGILGDIQILATKVEGKFVFLEIRLSERPRLSKFGFRELKNGKEENLKKGDADELKEQLDLIRGRIITDAIKKNSERKIRRYYKEKGFLNVEVESRLDDDPVLKNSVVLNFVINKKEKVKIREIEFFGNTAATDSRLRKKMKGTNEKLRISLGANLNKDLLKLEKVTPKTIYRRFKEMDPSDLQEYITSNLKVNIFSNKKFSRGAYSEDKDMVIAYYNSLGYRDAEIVKDTVYQLNPEELKVELTIEEGRQYYYRDIEWKGNYIHSDKELATILSVNKGDIYDREELNKRLNFNPNGFDVTSLYMDDGYLFFSVTPVETRIEGDSVDIEMRIYEGEQATINEIIIKGNTVTSDDVIRREIRTYPGYKFSRRDVIRTQTFLSQLGYFDPEKIGINPIPNPIDGTVDIEYVVEERPSNQIELSGGWGGAFGFVGSLGLVINNFSTKKMFKLSEWSPLPSGDGQRLSLRAQANGRRFQTYSVSFTEPWLGGRKPHSLTVSFTHSRQNLISGFSNQKFGHFYISGVTAGLGRRLPWPDDYFVLNNTASLLFYDLNNFAVGGGLDLDGPARNFSLINTISRNSIDNPTYPRSGSQVSLSVILTPPYSAFRDDNTFTSDAERYRWIEYHKWMVDNSWFMPIIGNLVLNGRMHFGFVGAYNKEIGVTPFERFTLGGSGLTGFNPLLGTEVIGLRGYADASLNPYLLAESVDVGKPLEFVTPRDLETPGLAFTKYVMELRYPLSLNPAATIYLQTFFEAGNNFAYFEDFSPFDVYRSVGFGARIFMPAFGLIGVDYGYGLDPVPGRPGVNGSQFHFSIGQQIR
jgi:outer membrane protein insertion porin family